MDEGTGGFFELPLLPAFVKLGTEPVVGDSKHLGRVVVALELLVVLEFVELALPLAGALVGEVHHVGRPVVKAVEDVGGVDDGGCGGVGFEGRSDGLEKNAAQPISVVPIYSYDYRAHLLSPRSPS